MNAPDAMLALSERVRRLEARLAREHNARRQAEQIIETKSLQLWEANRALSKLAAELEARVQDRTHELIISRQRALMLAETDALTGVANRACFNERLNELLERPEAQELGISVVLIDLDGFKAVNDLLGHAAGDSLLVETARRMCGAVRPGDFVARLGGDEFAIIALHQTEESRTAMAARLLQALCEPVEINGRRTPAGCSIGLAWHAADIANADDLLRNADMALYASKRQGRGRVTVFDQTLRAQAQRQAVLEEQVRHAVAHGQMRPWFQPITDRAAGTFVGAEVLTRWHLPDGEVRTPGHFLPTVESLQLLDAMVEQVYAQALREALTPVRNGCLRYVSINVSPNQFNQGWTQRQLPALLAQTGFPANALMVEITETALLNELEPVRELLTELRSRGVRIALDDFGVGYSNFSLLRHLPIDLIKLDRTLVCDIEHDEHARALVECILELALRLQIDVVAEGIETARQAEMLAAAGCQRMQGYWFARPQRALGTWFAGAGAQAGV